MKKVLKSKKGLVLLATMIVAVAAAVGAYAYFTTTGAGTGTASVGTSTALVLHGSAPANLYPGTSATVTFTADNPSTGHQFLNTIHLVSVVAYPTSLDRTNNTNAIATCGGLNSATSDFQMADVPVNHDYATGSGQAVTPTGTLVMNNLNASQDTCKNALLKLNLTSN
jgi:hypothetical protein